MTNGKLTVTMASVDLGTIYVYNYNSNLKRFSGSITGLKPFATNVLPNALCSIYKTLTGNAFDADTSVSGTFRVDNNSSSIYIRDLRYDDAATFKTAMSGVQLVYELVTPVEYTLTPTEVKTLLGKNNIFADCGNTNIKYKADATLYVDKKIEESTIIIELLLTALRNNEMKAPSSMSTNDIIIVSNKLYKATASIASGATLTVGTNVAEITVGEVLTSLLNI